MSIRSNLMMINVSNAYICSCILFICLCCCKVMKTSQHVQAVVAGCNFIYKRKSARSRRKCKIGQWGRGECTMSLDGISLDSCNARVTDTLTSFRCSGKQQNCKPKFAQCKHDFLFLQPKYCETAHQWLRTPYQKWLSWTSRVIIQAR